MDIEFDPGKATKPWSTTRYERPLTRAQSPLPKTPCAVSFGKNCTKP